MRANVSEIIPGTDGARAQYNRRMARVTAESPLPSVYKLAIFATEAVLLAAWIAVTTKEAAIAAVIQAGLIACHFAVVCALALALATRRRESRLPIMGNAALFATFRFVKFVSWCCLGVFLTWLYLAPAAVAAMSEAFAAVPDAVPPPWFPWWFWVKIPVTLLIFIQAIMIPTGGAKPSLRRFGSVAEDDWSGPLRELADRNGVARSTILLLASDDAKSKKTKVKPPGPAAYRMEGRTAVFFFDREFMVGLSPRERLAVFAHELAHHRLDHSRRARREGLVVNLIGAAAFAGWLVLLTGEGDSFWSHLAPATFLAWLTCLLLHPLYMAHLRSQERQANELALRMTDDAEAFESAMTRLADHLGGASPVAAARSGRWLHWMFDTHPTLEEVLSQAAAFERR